MIKKKHELEISPHFSSSLMFTFISISSFECRLACTNLHLYYLLQERNQAACPPLVRFGQAYVFQVENQVLTVFGSEDSTCVRTEQQAGLAEFLQDMSRRSLGTAVNYSNLCGTELRQGMAEEHA